MSLGADFGKILMGAGKPFLAEQKLRERSGRSNIHWRPDPETSFKDAVYEVMEEAMGVASGNGTYAVSARTLFYQVRPMVQKLTDKGILTSKTFRLLLVSYQQEKSRLEGLYYEPRGSLREPHTGTEVPLGTLEIARYGFPEHVFDKILYVEKTGLNPVWKTAKLAERYDMAIASGNGYPAEACRNLFADAEAGDYKLFVLHDADPDGYGIAHTMAEETERMPDYSVNVIDIGLTVAGAIEAGLETESFYRKKRLPYWMQLTGTEEEWFGQRGETHRMCERVELNAFTNPNLVAYVEAQLVANGAGEKMIIPADVVTETAEEAHRKALEEWVAARMAEKFDTEAMVDTMVEETAEQVIDGHAEWISDAYAKDRATYWRNAIEKRVGKGLEDIDEDLRSRLEELLRDVEEDQE
jgi:hypothetical protein